ncbi:MAG: S26 family signal peptidase [Chitinophagaceae bacterium]
MKMIRCFLLLVCCYSLSSCKQRLYKASSGSMKNTIPIGKHFLVTSANEFKNNDIVVFNYYGNDYQHPSENEPHKFEQHWEQRVYRLVASSGDIIEIKDGDLFINDKPVPLPEKGLLMYEIKARQNIPELEDRQTDDNTDVVVNKVGDTILYYAAITAKQVADFRNQTSFIWSIRKYQEPMREDDTMYAKNSMGDQWSTTNYGPLKIPSPGETFVVTEYNYKLYKNIPGVHVGNNTLKEKLYFVLGDNRNGAEDSRFIGLIPQSNMQGIVKIK